MDHLHHTHVHNVLGDLLDACSDPAQEKEFVLPWPSPGNPVGFLTFTSATDWKCFVKTLELNPLIPEVVKNIYQRAQRIFLLSWLDAGMLKVAELVALAALEVSLNDRYGFLIREAKVKKGTDLPIEKPLKFEELLSYMIDVDGLTDDRLPFIQRYGGSVMPMLSSKKPERHGERPHPRMNLCDVRNSLAHGTCFDGLPWSGLQELIRDLIEYSFRDFLIEGRTQD